jgi:tetratricopeptide (TPR) repeat protein
MATRTIDEPTRQPTSPVKKVLAVLVVLALGGALALSRLNGPVPLVQPVQASAGQLSNQAIKLAQQGQVRAALDAFTEAIRVDRSHVPALLGRGKLLRETGEPSRALLDLNTVLTVEPRNITGLLERSQCFSLLRRDREALQDLNAAVEAAPNQAETFAARASWHARHGDYSQALADYDHAILLRPDDAALYRFRGAVKSELGDTRGASDDLRRSGGFEDMPASTPAEAPNPDLRESR